MSKIYFTLTGTNHYFGKEFLKKKKFVIVTISTKKQNINGVIRWKRHREFD